MTYSSLKSILLAWAYANTLITTIWADQNAPRPDGVYLTLKLFSFVKIGEKDMTSPSSTTGKRTIRIDENFTLNIVGYGSGSENYLQSLKMSLQKENVLEGLRTSGVVVRDDYNITNVTVTLDNQREERYLYELIMGFTHDFEEDAGLIETYEIASEIENPV